MSRVAVVILNYNGKDLLSQFLPSVLQHSRQTQVIVADNNSTDQSRQWLSQNYPHVPCLHLPENKGYSGGYNQALKQIQADYYVLLNSDVEVTENWLTPVIELMDADASVAAAQPKILSYRQKDHFEYAGAGGGFIDTLGYPFCRGRIFDELEADRGQYNDIRPVFWASGACLFVRSTHFHEVGGLDEDFFAHMEEIDLCWRLQRAGKKIVYTGKSVVYHLGGGTLAASHPRKTYLNFRNGLALVYQHLPLRQLWWKFPLRWVLDWVAAVRFLTESPAQGAAVWKAHAHFLLDWRKTNQKRKRYARQLGWSTTCRYYPRLIVFDFFVLKRKTFSSLPAFNSPK